MSERKHAVVRSWHTERGFGILRNGPASSLDQYFLHVSCIRSGTAAPEVGMEVFFEVDESKPVPDGKLPRAIRADVIVPGESEQAESNDNR